MTMQPNEAPAQPATPAGPAPGSRQAAMDAFSKAVAEHAKPEVKTEADPSVNEEAVDTAATAELEKPEPASEAEAAPTPTAEKLRARERIQRIRATAIEERERAAATRIAAERQAAELAQQQQRYTQELQRLQQLQEMARLDPSKFIDETKLDMNRLVKSQIEANKPDARISRLEQVIEQQNQLLQQLQRQPQEQAQRAQKQSAEREFITLARTDDFAALKAVYEGRDEELVAAAYRVQEKYEAHFGRKPSLREIAYNLDKIEKKKYANYERYQKGAATGSPPQSTQGKSRTPSVSTKVHSGPPSAKPLTEKEKRENAIKAFEKATAKPR